MTWFHVCPRCGHVSLRSCTGDRKPVCKHEYHDASQCGLCGWCRNGLVYETEGEPDALLRPPQFRVR